MAQIEFDEAGGATIIVYVEPEKIAPLLYKHVDLAAVIEHIEDPAVAAAAAEELAVAEAWYKAGYEAQENDGAIFLNKAAVVAAFRAHSGYMNAAQRKAAKEAEEAAAAAALAAAEDDAAAAEDELLG